MDNINQFFKQIRNNIKIAKTKKYLKYIEKQLDSFTLQYNNPNIKHSIRNSIKKNYNRTKLMINKMLRKVS